MNTLVIGSYGIIGSDLTNVCINKDESNIFFIDKSENKKKLRNFFKADFTKEEEVSLFFNNCKENKVQFEKIFINAGGATVPYDQYISDVEELELENWHKIINGNLDIFFLTIKHLLRTKTYTKDSSIVVTSSIHSIVGPRFDTYKGSFYKGKQMSSSIAYSASKSAMNGMVKYLCSYLSEKSIRINAVLPGGVYSGQEDNFIENYSKHVPLGRMANSKEIANIIYAICSDDFSYMNGQLVVVDGGKSSW